MIKIELNLYGIEDPKDLHRYLAAALDFPDYYGMNLDALYDCLTDICDDTCLGIRGMDKVGDESYAIMLRQVFEDAEEANPHLCVFFADQMPDITDTVQATDPTDKAADLAVQATDLAFEVTDSTNDVNNMDHEL